MRATILLLLVSGGCIQTYSPNRPVEVVADDFILQYNGGQGAQIVHDGIHMWDQVGAQFRLSSELTAADEAQNPETIYLHCKSETEANLTVKDGPATTDVIGDYDDYDKQGEMDINCDLWKTAASDPQMQNFQAIWTTAIAHETGHALGLQHTQVEGSVMYPSISLGSEAYGPGRPAPATALGPADVSQFYQVTGELPAYPN